MKKSILAAFCLFISTSFLISQSQSVVVANASGATITDWGTRTFTQQVNIGFNPAELIVLVDLNHTWVGDLQLKVTNPSGNSAIVFKELGTNPCFGCDENDMFVGFRDGAAITYAALNATCSYYPAYSGQARPLQNLNPLLNGTVNGNWTVEIKDLWPTETGIINSITLVFSGVFITPAIATISLEGDQSIGGDPVQLGTGSFISQNKDFVLQGKNMQLDFTRTYNSLNYENNGPFGNGWSHSYNYRLVNYGDFLWDVHYADGHVVSFIPTGDEGQSTPLYSLTKDSLQQNPDLSFSLFTQEMTHYHFDQEGKLVSVIDLHGNAAVLHYTVEALDSIVISGGRKLVINYTDDKISSVTDPLNRIIQYSYDTEDNLITVTNAENEATTFEYDPENRLSAIINPLGDTIISNIYDPVSGKVIEQEDAEGEIMTFLYTAPDPEEDFTGFPESNSALQAFPVHRDVKRRLEAESMKQLKSEEKTESNFENQNKSIIAPDIIEHEEARTDRFHKKGYYHNSTGESPFAPMEVIDISGDFELGPTFADNGWTVINGSVTNKWYLGNVPNPLTTGARSAYVSNDGGVTNAYTITSTSVVHFFRDVTIPAGQTNVQLSFNWWAQGETSSYDALLVSVAPTSYTPTASSTSLGTGILAAPAITLQQFWLQSTVQTANLQIPAGFLSNCSAPATFRLIFTWKNDGSDGTQPPVAIDNISLIASAGASLAPGIYSVGVGGDFTTLTAAVAAYSTACLTGPIVFELIDATYSSETFPIVIGENGGANAANTLTIRPAAGNVATISGNSASAILRLNGADYITIDGSNSGGTDRSLSILNTATTANSAAIWVSSLGIGFGATNNTIKNLNIMAGDIGTTTSLHTFGIQVSGTSLTNTGTGADNDNLTIENNLIKKARYGIYARATAVANANGNLQILNNIIGSTDPTEYVTFRGIDITYAEAPVMSGNSIFNLKTTLSASNAAIDCGPGVNNGSIKGNHISGIYAESTSGYGAFGINFSSTTSVSNNLIANNFISDIKAVNYSTRSTSYNAFGIRLAGGTNTKVYHNSVNLFGNITIVSGTPAVPVSAPLLVTTTSVTGLEVINNIFRNVQTFASGGPEIYSIWVPAAFSFASINNNIYHGSSAGITNYFLGRAGTTNYANLDTWKTYSGGDNASIEEGPNFMSDTDLHIGLDGSHAESNAMSIVLISLDFDGDIRYGNLGYTGSGSAPDIGADEGEYSLTDISGPNIYYSDMENFLCIGGQQLTAEITDPSMVDVDPGSKPRLWFKKSTDMNILAATNTSVDDGWKYVEATNDTSPFLFDFDYDLLTSSVDPGDVIEYFVVAQDIIVPPNVGTNQATYSNPSVNVSLGPDVFPVSDVKSFAFFDELTASADPSFVCVSDDVNLSLVENPGSDANYQWESSPAGNNTWSSIPGATTASITVPDVAESTDFRCRVYCGVQESNLSPTNQVSVIMSDPQVLSTTPDLVYFPNGPVSMILGATASAGSTIDWYAAGTGGTLLGTGTNFETPPISESTTFYAEAVDALSGCKSQREPVLAEIFNSSPYRLTIVTNPDNSQTIVFHDEQIRKVNETNELGHAVLYGYDSLSNPIVLTNENNFSVNRSYDTWGNMLSDTLPGNRITLIEYNSFNSPIQITDARGNQKFFYYDPVNNNLDSVLLEDGTKIRYLYDISGQMTQMTDGKGNITNYSYSDFGDLLSIQTAAGTRHFTYDAAGRKMSETDENGHATTYTYDLNNNVLVVTDPLGKTVESTYDANNQLLSIKDKNGSITYYSYDKKGRKVSSTDPLGEITSYLYDVRDNLISVTDPNNHVVSYTYDAANRKTSMTNALGTTLYTYDPAGNLIRVTDPDNRTTDYTYTPTNKKVSMTDGMGNLTSYTYDSNDNLISMTDAMNRTTEYAYDPLNRMENVTDPMGNLTSVEYDAAGNRQTVIDPNGHAVTYTYDAANRMISSADAAGNVISYTLDNNGNITTITKPTGTITKTFDALNRIITVVNSTGDNYTFTYDDNGNVLTMTNLTGTSEMEYDSLNRLTGYTDPYGKSVAFEYDDAGNKTSMVYPGNKTVNYSYDGANNLVSLTDWLGKIYTYSYDASGRIKELLYPNEIRCSYTYDQAGRLISRIYYDADSTVMSGSYFDLNPVGNRISEQKFGQQSGVPEDLSRVYAYTADDVMMSDSIWTYTNDLSGNRIAETDGTANSGYTFTVDNLLTGRINTNADVFSYTYNPLGHRLSVTEGTEVKRFVVDISTSLSKVLQITDENGEVIADYIYGLGLLGQIDSLDNPLYYHFDGQHNTIMLTDEDAVIQDWFTYDPFGTLLTHTGATEQPFTFLGEFGVETEAEGLYYVRARYYDAVNGRFLSKDTYEYDLNYPQTINRYVYSTNNPVSIIDFTGLCGQDNSDGDLYINHSFEIPEDLLLRILITGIETVKEHGQFLAVYKNNIKAWSKDFRVNKYVSSLKVRRYKSLFKGLSKAGFVIDMASKGINAERAISKYNKGEYTELDVFTEIYPDIAEMAGEAMGGVLGGAKARAVAELSVVFGTEIGNLFVQTKVGNWATNLMAEKLFKTK